MNPKLFTAEKPLKVKVKKIAGNLVELVFSDQQSVSINVKFLPPEAQEGDSLYLSFITDAQLNRSKQEIAKAVLQEILGSPNVQAKKQEK